MKKVLVAIAALSMMVVSLTGCPINIAGNGSVGNSGSATSSK